MTSHYTGAPVVASAEVPIPVSAGVVAGVSIVAGLILVFVGYRIFRVALALATTYFVYALMYSLLVGVGVTEAAIVCWTSLAVGMVAGAIVLCYYKLGIFALGCVAGGSLAVWIMSWTDIPFITSVGWRWAFIIVLALIVGILALFLIKVVAIVATAWVGSFMTFVGIDVFAQTGFAQAVSEILSGQVATPNLYSPAAYAMLSACVVLAIIGMIVQFTLTGKGDHHSQLANAGKPAASEAPA